MKRAEVELPDALYRQVEGLAAELHVTVPELLGKTAEQMLHLHAKASPKLNGDWHFPEGRHLGAFRASADDWRLLSNEGSD